MALYQKLRAIWRNEAAFGIVQTPPKRPARMSSFTYGIISIIAATAYFVAVCLFLFWTTLLLFVPLVGLLLYAGIVISKDLVRNRASRSFKTGFTLLLILSILAFLILTPGPDLWNYGVRLRVFLAGGQDRLHSWAMEVLKMPPHTTEAGAEYSNWRISKDDWPKQVKMLRPDSVDIQTIDHSTGEKIVQLCYGGGFHHWFIVLTPPKVNTRKFHDSNYGTIHQLRQGVYVQQEG